MQAIVNFDSGYLRKFVENYNKSNMSNKIVNYYSAAVCTSNNSYSVLQYQPKTDITMDPDNGLFFCEPQYNEKMKSFLDLSVCSDNTYGLVLTPEYSVPLSVVEEFLKDIDKIKTGTLYCLCCQCVTHSVMNIFLTKLKTKYNTEVWDIACHYLHQQTLVCCLLYILKVRFFLEDHSYIDRIFVVPQFKTRPMKDPGMSFERQVLGCGEIIIEFGLENQIKFMSIICADVFNLKLINELHDKVRNNKALIFNPQLNKKPQNDYFRFMRNLCINYSGNDNVRILTLNWSSDTKFIMPDNSILGAVEASWSSLYEKFEIKHFETYMNVLNTNANKGMNFAHDYHLAIFFLPSREHIFDMRIAKLVDDSSPYDVQITVPIKINKQFIYDYTSNVFVESEKSCMDMLDGFFLQNKEFVKLINCDSCRGICSLSKINSFVSSLCYRTPEKDFEIINDGKITSVTSKHYASEYSKGNFYLCKRVLKKMKDREVTKKFLSKNSSFEYIIDKNNPLFNVVYYCEDSKQFCRVIYLKYKTHEDVQILYKNLLRDYKELAENFLIYYEDVDGVHLFQENVHTEILKKNTPKSVLIAGGDLNENKSSD